MDKVKRIKSVWLVKWEVFAREDKERYLTQLGIKNEIIDIIDSRKSFDKIIEMALKLRMIFC